MISKAELIEKGAFKSKGKAFWDTKTSQKGKQTIKCKYFSEQMDCMSQCEWSLILGNKKN